MTIGLTMIVKNECAVIQRCLDSVIPFIDHWLIVDTGSTDDTVAIILERMTASNIPGSCVVRDWANFGHNRSEALYLARDKADYSLMIDADDVLMADPDFSMPELTADSYTLMIDYPPTRYHRAQLFANSLPWRYEGVLHEYPVCEGARTQEHIEGLRIVVGQDGARRRDPEKYRKDAIVLEKELETQVREDLRIRYRFYLAQSLRDSGQLERAIEAYLLRADLAGWDQERYISLCEAAKLSDQIGRPQSEVVALWGRAIVLCPNRLDAYHGVARYLRLKDRFAESYLIAKFGLAVSDPERGLFEQPWIGEYGLLDEFAVSAYWSGHYQDCINACDTILGRPTLPDHERSRIMANKAFAVGKL